MTRRMFDSISAASIPPDAQMMAGYVDGKWPSYAAMFARFPGRRVVTICVDPAHYASVLDCETGDATPEQAADWVARMYALGRTPTVYCNLSAWPLVRAAVGLARAPLYWIAHYDNVPEMIAGAVAKQYQTTGPWDQSIVADYWPGVDPIPPTPPPPLPPPWKEPDMYLVYVEPATLPAGVAPVGTFTTNGVTLAHVPPEVAGVDNVANLEAAGVKVVGITYDYYKALGGL